MDCECEIGKPQCSHCKQWWTEWLQEINESKVEQEEC